MGGVGAMEDVDGEAEPLYAAEEVVHEPRFCNGCGAYWVMNHGHALFCPACGGTAIRQPTDREMAETAVALLGTLKGMGLLLGDGPAEVPPDDQPLLQATRAYLREIHRSALGLLASQDGGGG
jgi:predicted RNA-binding Zn-ribbon protein involved in translation (DUF1610 family)